jgi:hypothetical protein
VDGELGLSPIANLFWNARERRLRAGWRLLVFLVIVFLVAAVDGSVWPVWRGASQTFMRIWFGRWCSRF